MSAGVLVIDKPEGPTSHDIVALARRRLQERRIGHCGTLDPMATGVLVLAVGAATRLVQYLTADEKQYDTTLRFGCTTDSYDRTGTVVAESDARPTRVAVEAALERFRGPIRQVPPPYSAKKIGGTRAYVLARRGTDLGARLAPVDVVVTALTLTAFDGDTATLRMTVSPGFYVRSLVHDLGEALGTGAVMTALRRTASGPFGVEGSVSMDELATASAEALAARLTPPAALLPAVPALALDAAAATRARHGADLPMPADWLAAPPLVRLIDGRGGLVGLAVPGQAPGLLHPAVILG